MDHIIKITSAYIVLSLYIITVLVLLGIIFHLIHVFRKKHINPAHAAKKGLKMFMIVTICGILAFTVASIFEICVILQTILCAAHTLHNAIFFDAHAMEYLIATFDTLGHLCVIFVFISRFEYTFGTGTFGTSGGGTQFGSNKCVIVTLKSVLFALLSCSAAIILLIIIYHKSQIIIICEIIWMLLVEIVMLWLLYLFTSKLYLLLKISLTNHIKSGESRDFCTELTKTIEEKSHGTPKQSPAIADEEKEKECIELTVSKSKSMNINGAALDLVCVMNKMTLLVLLTVFTSTLSVVGNIFIEIHELETIEKYDIDLQSIWASILPLIDNIVTCFMLYLQFNFTINNNIYRMLLGHLDMLFLKVWLGILKPTKKNRDWKKTIIANRKRQRAENKKKKMRKSVNPKVYFSNERTFLGWFQAAVFIGGSGLTIHSFNKNDPAGYCLIITAMFVLLYAIILYYRRNCKLLKGQMDGLHDMFGPAFLVSLVFFVFLYSFLNGNA